MISIKQESREFTKVERYLLTQSPDIVSMQKVEDGTSIEYGGHLVFIDTKEDGEEVEILSIITPEKKVYSVQSKTFRRSLEDILTVMEGEPFSIIKFSGASNAGRKYVNCKLDISKLM